MTALPFLIAFGPLAPWPSRNHLQQLRLELRQSHLYEPIITAIYDLALLWQALVEQDSALEALNGSHAADELAAIVTGTAEMPTPEEKRNIITMPMTIVTQIVQYLSYLGQSDGSVDHNAILRNVTGEGGVQGFCAGLLSALAVASGSTEEEVVEMASTAVQLAYCIGAYVDMDQANGGGHTRYSNFAMRWKAPATLDDICNDLLKYPETYVAVIRDAYDITVTTPTSITALQQGLSTHGVSVLDTGISGRYHVNIHTEAETKILNACQGRINPRFGDQKLVRSNANGEIIPHEEAVWVALHSILTVQADWYHTICTATPALFDDPGNSFILSIGADAIPQSVARRFSVVKTRAMLTSKVDHYCDTSISGILPPQENGTDGKYPEHAVAVIGMSCKFPGADSIDEFWSLLTEGKSMLEQMPKDRFDLKDLPRAVRGLRYHGNFVRHIQSFDHRFFKTSSREAASMDPQQRILLQLTYQAMESSGYFSDPSRPRDIGCYIGGCAVDYDGNVGSHPPTAYATTGTLRAFQSGKLSHYFGWSGPSITFDTACSSSAVAIHSACTALEMGECSQAVAGGVALFTTPYLYENLAAAHFLSPTGATKPFDASADGYCRGEGLGLVVLKKLSNALADGDNILGVIAGSAINQNANCVSITVPHSPSQSNLLERVSKRAGVSPQEVTFVEAHGTGTPVGDPIEMESIRKVFGGPGRKAPLIVSSVKGNIGHLEGASGVAALIKVILQMEYRTACVQASFKTLNPKIPSLEADKLCIPTSNCPLSGDLITACINNYGAAGSNTAMMLIEAPRKNKQHMAQTEDDALLSKLPIHISAASTTSLINYCQLLEGFCGKTVSTLNAKEKAKLLRDVAFSLAKRQNQELSHMLVMTVTDIDQLQAELRRQLMSAEAIQQRLKEPPVILCFGGQVGESVGLSKHLWKQSPLFRSYLDRCNTALCTLGYPSIYPTIFQKEPVKDIVALQSAIFSTQYASAQAWLESGLRVDGVVGHSLGQFAALCVSGTLSLRDGLKLVAGRAALMQKYWGSEPGSMIAVEADQTTIESITSYLSTSSPDHIFEIACYNGPTSHVVVSDEASADHLEAELVKRSIRHKRLSVTHGFHSRFTEPIIPYLESLASALTFHRAKIPIETCTSASSWTQPTAQLVAAHTRDPVFFTQAVRRIQARVGVCTFLEAGSSSSIVSMVRRALDPSIGVSCNFIPMELNKPTSLDNLAETTVNLWKRGHQVQFWNFHNSNGLKYDFLRLPSYEFDKPKHWLALQSAPPVPGVPAQILAPKVLIRLTSSDSEGHHFEIGSRSDEYLALVKGHLLLGQPECPLSVYIELASRAATLVEEKISDMLLAVNNLHIQSPLGLATDRAIRLDLQPFGASYSFRITSKPLSSDLKKITQVCHVTGTVSLQAQSNTLSNEFSRYERLITKDRFAAAFDCDDDDATSIQGSMVYKVFSQTTEYADFFRNVKSVAFSDGQVVGKVLSPKRVPDSCKGSITQPCILDNFIQVADLHTNSIQHSSDKELFWLSNVERVQFGPEYQDSIRVWDVLCLPAVSTSSRELAHDIFVYNAATGRLALLLLGARFISISRSSLIDSLSRADDSRASTIHKIDSIQMGLLAEQPQRSQFHNALPVPTAQVPKPVKQIRLVKDAKTAIHDDICIIMEKIADVPANEVRGTASFDDLGVDSLMMIEVIGEISTFYKTELPIDDLEQLTDFNSLIDYLHGRGCRGTGSEEGDADGSTPSDSLSISSSITTADTSPIQTPSTCQYANGDKLSGSVSNLQSNIIGQAAPSVSKPAETIDSLRAVTNYDQSSNNELIVAQQVFDSLRFDFDKYSEQTGFHNFWKYVYPNQKKLVEAYIVETFRDLGCDMASLANGQQLPYVNFLPKYGHLMRQFRKILVDGGLLQLESDGTHVRTAQPIDPTPASVLFEEILQKHPLHASEHRLLNVSASQLVKTLTGKEDPRALLFANRVNKGIMADVYANAPMCQASTRLLADFLVQTFSALKSDKVFQILEVGAGTGGTARYLVEFLISKDIKFEYTFTDISSGLVSQAQKFFAGYDQMKFMTLDCDRAPPQQLHNKFDVVVATNCIHATRSATSACTNIAPLLHADGFFCLVEFTKGVYWFDLVYGLLEGWWLFEDGRQHALADQWFWDNALRTAGFQHVTWTDGSTSESQTMRVICGFKTPAERESFKPLAKNIVKRAGIPTETFTWKKEGSVELQADVYYPKIPDSPGKQRRIALMIHGGGHLLYSRQDIPMKHVRVLLQRGFLPVSVDYRFCPELSLFDGPVTDCCDALKWARETLPLLHLSGPKVQVHPTKLLAMGWSSGGQLAMTLGYMAKFRGIKPPDVILPFYSPSDLEAEFWSKPIYPAAAEEPPCKIWGELDCVLPEPIVAYTPMSDKKATGLSLTLKDDRARLILHMNWTGQSVNVLVRGLPHKSKVAADDTTDWKNLPPPPIQKIRECSPYWHILEGTYTTPTFMVHGNNDDWIPCSMSEKTIATLKEKGVPCGIIVADQCGHAFDLFPREDPLGVGWLAIEAAYDFACAQMSMDS
ncbi:hypothetical protein UA08_04992 [Talaromyces atroroseus]|uniref:Uncharacterized protein n=1 Tax=Talaromyces atroroseus TaxID=1441469 RepID=A0A225B157_TALAT|nr:hypothetical protein UA08_04992 [Talaromyces atroroseus]OKL59537.1 hypothetical protein UA08_04992 [Talaromyces atroroseus]